VKLAYKYIVISHARQIMRSIIMEKTNNDDVIGDSLPMLLVARYIRKLYQQLPTSDLMHLTCLKTVMILFFSTLSVLIYWKDRSAA